MEFINYYISENVDNINPINFIKKGFIALKISKYKERLFLENPILAIGVEESFYIEKATEDWNEYYNMLSNIKIPNSFMQILSNNNLSKKDQTRIFKGQKISPIEMSAMFIQAFNDLNYTYSYYHFDIKNIEKENYKLPEIFKYSNDKLTVIGETNLSDFELKQMINQRNARVVNFLDNGEHWHCFFMTYRSLSGKETWNLEKPHYHYLSDKWNIPRDNAIDQFKNKNYPSTNVHIICNI